MGMWCAGQLKVGDSAVCMMRCDGGMLRTAKTYLLIPQGKARVGGNELPVGLLDRPLSAFLEKDTGKCMPHAFTANICSSTAGPQIGHLLKQTKV